MIKIYNQLKSNLTRINFDKLYPGFHPFDFALYNKNEVILNDHLFPYTEDFIGNTTIKYKGENIAIWDMQYPIENIDIFTSKIVHEMFHAFQMETNETRFPNEFNGLYYQYTINNIQWKIKETKLLVDAYRLKSIHLFKQFIASKNERKKVYPKEVEYENKIETVEGLARLMELNALSQLDTRLRNEEIEKIIRYLLEDKNYLPIRVLSYNVGALIVITAKKLKIGFQEDCSKTIVDWFLPDELEKEVLKQYTANKNVIANYHKRNQSKLEQFFNNELETINEIEILGLDPMNTLKIGNHLLFNHFVRIRQNNKVINLFGESCVALSEKEKHKIYIIKRKNNNK